MPCISKLLRSWRLGHKCAHTRDRVVISWNGQKAMTTDRALMAAIVQLKRQRVGLIRELNETEERISALELARQLHGTGRARAYRYAEQIIKRIPIDQDD